MFWSGLFLVNVSSQVLLQIWHTGQNKHSTQGQRQMSCTCIILFCLQRQTIPSRSYQYLLTRRRNGGSKCKEHLVVIHLGSENVGILARVRDSNAIVLARAGCLSHLPTLSLILEEKEEASLSPFHFAPCASRPLFIFYVTRPPTKQTPKHLTQMFSIG